MSKLYIYEAEISACVNTEGAYQMGEVNLCEYGEEWDGNVRGYIENLDLSTIDDEWTIKGDGALGNVYQNFVGLDPIPGSVCVLCVNDEPVTVYWCSEARPGWISEEEKEEIEA